MDASTKNLAVIRIGGVEVWITETIVNTWIIMLAVIVFSIVVRVKIKKFKTLPGAFQNAVEAIVETFDSFVSSIAGDKLYHLGNWFFMMISFIMLSSVVSLIGLRSPTADWSMTFACAFATFLLSQIMGLKYRRTGYLKSFFEPYFFFFPLNLIGELSRPISLSFRLFGNVLTGTIILALLYSVAPIYLRFVLPAALHAYFDLITGAIQTYIFCVLSMSFIRAASAETV